MKVYLLGYIIFITKAVGCDSFSVDVVVNSNKNIAFCRKRSSFMPRLLLLLSSTSINNNARNGLHQPLFMSTNSPIIKEDIKEKHPRKSDSHHVVVYQKIVRPSEQLPPILFLGNLVEYLQDIFSLPSNLPMVYEKHLPPDDDDDHNNNEKNGDDDRSILWLDSPLTRNTDATRMAVEVIGVYSQEKKNINQHQPSAPDMAMVVVRKKKLATTTTTTARKSGALPIMMKNLFDDSEKRILRALDRGLDDLIAGRTSSGSSNRPNSYDAGHKKAQATTAKRSMMPNVRTVQEALQAEEWLEDGVEDLAVESTTRSQTKNDRVIVDTVATLDDDQEQQQPSQPQRREAPQTPAHEDYAIRAAKKAAVLRVMQKKPPHQAGVPNLNSTATIGQNEEYSVKAARQRVLAVEQPAQPMAAFSTNDKMQSETPIRSSNDNLSPQQEENRSRHVNQTNVSPDYKNEQQSEFSEENMFGDSPGQDEALEHASELSAAKGFTEPTSKRRLNIVYHDEKTSDPTSEEEIIKFAKTESTQAPQPITNDKVPISQQQLEFDVAEAARKALSEISEQGWDMSAEELLEDVLKFGKQQDKENSAGNSFVSGAMEKAKELLRDRNKQREEKRIRAVKEIENNPTNPFAVDIIDNDSNKPSSTKLSPDDELRQMFEAGERFADGRISLVYTAAEPRNLAESKGAVNDEMVVDELLAGETTVSRHARVLDDELTELEVRINKSPDEELDGTLQNRFFDILSGPEVYNPNVDPETTVNWPGALPGTKQVRLPLELDEAVKQARFAVDVLSKLTEVGTEDINAAPGETTTHSRRFRLGDKDLSLGQVEKLLAVANEAIQIGLIANPLDLMAERSRLQIVIKEMWDHPEERFREIASNYKDLLLSDNFVYLVRERLALMAQKDLDSLRRNDDVSSEGGHKRERDILGHLVNYVQLLLKEARALGAELEAQQLEVIRSICKVAMDPSRVTEEETALALSDAVRDMRPLFDDAFVAYLKYAVAEEEGRLARAGLLDDPDHNQWLFVLKIVQQGVYTEIARGINRYIEHIWYVLRMKTKTERRLLLETLIDVMPSMDVRPFVQVVENIAGSLGDSARGDFDGLGTLTNQVLQLRRDVNELLPPDRIDRMSRDADEWVAKQKRRLLEHRKLTKQRITAARETEHLDVEIESLGRRGEVERMT